MEEIQLKSGPFRSVPQVTADLINLEIQGFHHEGCGGGREETWQDETTGSKWPDNLIVKFWWECFKQLSRLMGTDLPSASCVLLMHLSVDSSWCKDEPGMMLRSSILGLLADRIPCSSVMAFSRSSHYVVGYGKVFPGVFFLCVFAVFSLAVGVVFVFRMEGCQPRPQTQVTCACCFLPKVRKGNWSLGEKGWKTGGGISKC